MYNIALEIRSKDWLYILLIGILFGTLLSSLGYGLLQYPIVDGAIFGFILGFNITLFSLLFISNMNKRILPRVDEVFWLPAAMLFSFLSGFLGTYLGVYLALFLNLEMMPGFVEKDLEVATAIGILTYVVGALLYRFVKLRNEKDLVDYEFVQSRLKSLERQLNPHFLFNALNSIAELIHHNPEKAEMAVLKVSSFLRNTMKESALLSLEEEIRNVKDYVELENIRFSGKIILHLPQKLFYWQVPKFSLQLLVENAIKHGFKDTSKNLNIWIELDQNNNSIYISNDGETMRSNKFGVGLSNLKQRLKLLCKGSIKSIQDDKKVKFCITLGNCNEDTNS